MADNFVGEIRIFAGNFAPQGWALCQGQVLPISQNTALFSLLGTTYGGNGTTTFALPNLQGRAPMHPGAGTGLTVRNLGDSGGAEQVTITPAEAPPHTHALRAASGAATASSPAGNVLANTGTNPIYAAGNGDTPLSAGALNPAGGDQPHNNLMPYLTLNYIIATQGIYPARS